jgi:hypothetical protein
MTATVDPPLASRRGGAYYALFAVAAACCAVLTSTPLAERSHALAWPRQTAPSQALQQQRPPPPHPPHQHQRHQPDDPLLVMHDPPPPPDLEEHYRQLCIHAYYTSEMAAGRRACEALLQTPGVDRGVRYRAKHNRGFYARALDELMPVAYARLLDPSNATRAGWPMFNPTVLPLGDDGYLALVRSSNYVLDDTANGTNSDGWIGIRVRLLKGF